MLFVFQFFFIAHKNRMILGMKVPTVSKFLWCFDLTTGGLFLGYVGAVTNAGCALALLYELVADTDEFEEEVIEFAEEIEPVDAFVEGIIGHKARNRKDLPFWGEFNVIRVE